MRTNKEHRVNGGAYGPEEGRANRWFARPVHGSLLPRLVCVRGITASFTRTSGGLCTALRIRSTPRNSGSDSRRTVRSERSRPRPQLGAVVQEWTLSACCRSMPTPPPRSYRDRKHYGWRPRGSSKARIRTAWSRLKTCRVETLPRWLLGRGERFRSGLMSITKERARADYF